jgi:hypothetical protein
MKAVNSAPPDLSLNASTLGSRYGAGQICLLNFYPRLYVDKRVIPLSRRSGSRGNPLKPDSRAAEDRQGRPSDVRHLQVLTTSEFGHFTSDLEDTCNP